MKRTSWPFFAARALERATATLRTCLRYERHLAAVRRPRQVGLVPEPPTPAALTAAGFSVRPFHIDSADFRRYLHAGRYRRLSLYALGLHGPAPLLLEKALEHYVAARLLAPGPGDLLIDIASGGSPAAHVYARLYGCRVLRQDRDFLGGIHGDRVGSDASRLPLADSSVSQLVLHCSFEHFEGDEDQRFLKEAQRVLRPGGRLCILPLYLHSRYAILSDPVLLDDGGRAFEEDAVLCLLRGFGSRHGRHYDLAHLASRVGAACGTLRLVLHAIDDASAIHPACYLRYAALFEKPI